jgi:ferredoxin
MDAVMAAMMGLEAGRLRSLQKAKELGLGDFDLQAIEIVGELEQIPDFKLPPLSGEHHMANQDIQEMLGARAGLKPQADPELCTACGECIEHCPVSALTMGHDNIPEVDADTCITCFCCQELCPEKAMSLQ